MAQLARLRAGTRIATKKRDYAALPSVRPTVEEWKTFLEKPGDDGGFEATQIQPIQWLTDGALLAEPKGAQLKPNTLGDGTRAEWTMSAALLAKQDYNGTRKLMRKAPAGKYVSPWAVPNELIRAILFPKDCPLYTFDAADEERRVNLGSRIAVKK